MPPPAENRTAPVLLVVPGLRHSFLAVGKHRFPGYNMLYVIYLILHSIYHYMYIYILCVRRQKLQLQIQSSRSPKGTADFFRHPTPRRHKVWSESQQNPALLFSRLEILKHLGQTGLHRAALCVLQETLVANRFGIKLSVQKAQRGIASSFHTAPSQDDSGRAHDHQLNLGTEARA